MKRDANSEEIFLIAVGTLFAEKLRGKDPHERQRDVARLMAEVRRKGLTLEKLLLG